MNWAPRRSMVALALVGFATLPFDARAGLGPIQVLSAKGDKFVALIPFVDVLPDNAVSVSLADRNVFPQLSPYSASVGQLTFSLQRKLDGTPSGVEVMGPATFPESELRFAVAMSWASGGAVREYDVDYRHAEAPPHEPAPTAPARDEGKKPSLMPHPFPVWSDLGLGELKVKSLPGEPFAAETEVIGHGPALRERLRVRILPDTAEGWKSPEILRQVASMHYAVERTPTGMHLLQLTSAIPVNIPVFGFRLEVSLGSARMMRRYALETRDGGFAVSERTISGRTSAFSVLHVQHGDSLFSIARALCHDGRSLPDVMHRLYQENPHAFIAGDVNKLLAGVELKYPESWSSVRAVAMPPVVAAIERGRPAASAGMRVKVEELRTRLNQQDALLSKAQNMSQALERKLRTMQAPPAHTAMPAPGAPPASPVASGAGLENRARAAIAHVPKPVLIEGGAILAAAAAAIMLLRRRRRLVAMNKLPASADEVAPTIEGLRQWLRFDPSRQDMRYRLLQLLAIEDDAQGFIAEAEVARHLLGEDSPMWRGVVEMGRVLVPEYHWSDAPVGGATVGSVTPAGSAAPSARAPGVISELKPERPLMFAEELDAFKPGAVVFHEPEPEPEIEPAPEPDKLELAKLYLEMGDEETARELMRSGDST